MFANPLGLWALLSLPAILLLHLYRRRFTPRVVSALFLWDAASPSPLSGRTRTPLYRSASLWCELLAALLVSLCLAGPQGLAHSRHFVVVLDDTASLSASSTLDRARSAAAGFIGDLWWWERATVILTGPESGTGARILTGPGSPAAARAALRGWRPSAGHHGHSSAIQLARDVSGSTAILFATDRMLTDDPDLQSGGIGIAAVGTPLANAGITEATRLPGSDPAQPDTVRLQILNAGPAGDFLLQIDLDPPQPGLPPREEGFRIAENAAHTLQLPLPPDATATFHLRPVDAPQAGDALTIDDTLHLPPAPRRTLRIATTLGEDAVAFRLGRSPGSLDRVERLLPDLRVVPADLPADLWFGAPPEGGSGWALVPHRGGGESRPVGPLLADDAQFQGGLLQGVLLEGAIWSAWSGITLPGDALIQAAGLPVLTVEALPGGQRLHINLDPARSNLSRLPDWPLLLANLLQQRRRSLPGPAQTLLSPGAPMIWREAPAGAWSGAITVDHPGGDLTLPGWPVPGLHTLSGPGSGPLPVGVALLDAAESDLRQRDSGAVAPASRAASGSDIPELLLLAGALLFLALDLRVLGPLSGALSGSQGARA